MTRARRSDASTPKQSTIVESPTLLGGGVITGMPRFNENHPAFKEAAGALRRIEERFGLGRSEQYLMREALSIQAMTLLSQPDIPLSAPELWSDRRGTKENPVSFIRRVYANHLGMGLRRSHILALDKPLYTALGVWLHRHPETGFPELDA
ncbi:MAG: hypothetical protein CTY39_12295 [Hyphomicrobium sp.]|nr:MAG: hypothetical protein CTY39_12295 [Hyphomicrobium sp.]